MSAKAAVKRWMFGEARPFRVRLGLLRGLRFHIDPQSKLQRLLGLDEAELTRPVRRLAAGIRSGVDVGANDGWYAVYLASRPGVGRVLAFEPDPGCRARLAENLKLNPGCGAKITVSDQMVGDQAAPGWCRLDDVAADLPGPILLKIDVDGGELEVLRGGAGVLTGTDCRVVLEVHSRELEEQSVAILTSYGYTCRVVKNGWYRAIVPESRQLPHNRWVVATR